MHAIRITEADKYLMNPSLTVPCGHFSYFKRDCKDLYDILIKDNTPKFLLPDYRVCPMFRVNKSKHIQKSCVTIQQHLHDWLWKPPFGIAVLYNQKEATGKFKFISNPAPNPDLFSSQRVYCYPDNHAPKFCQCKDRQNKDK